MLHIDWNALLINLQFAGIGVTRAATLIEYPARDLCALARGEILEPPFSAGIKLLDLHLDRCPSKHAQLLHEDDDDA